ncbi:MAG: VOC family protein [Pyrinomonadaceae bacterium]|nr:VOC family protein [Pyrinomonadaceae bacterium]MCX7640898.1 VOC family protein [Pyrinomonadaceae bacterium]MDW8303920.1 VOC family protein [Acidobacteriota bacterium]
MSESGLRFSGTVDHLAVKCSDLQRAVEEYKKMGFMVETLYEDWAMMRDAKGFGIALLPPNSKHPPHIGLRVETMEELERAAKLEGRPIKPHRDGTFSFYTKGVDGNIIELVYYPPDFGNKSKDS